MEHEVPGAIYPDDPRYFEAMQEAVARFKRWEAESSARSRGSRPIHPHKEESTKAPSED